MRRVISKSPPKQAKKLFLKNEKCQNRNRSSAGILNAMNSFILFDFYGISLFAPAVDDNNNLRHRGRFGRFLLHRKWPYSFRETFSRIARLISLGSMIFLVIGTGHSAFSIDDNDFDQQSINGSAGNENATTIATATANHNSMTNIQFYYRISFHFKSYFCLISYLYVLIRAKEIGKVVASIVRRIGESRHARKLVNIRRLLAAIWFANVCVNAAFFIWFALDIDLYDVLHKMKSGGNSNATSITKNKKKNKSNTGNIFNDQVIAVLAKETLWAFYGFGWIIAGVLFMIWICFANYLVEFEMFDREPLCNVKNCSGGEDEDPLGPHFIYTTKNDKILTATIASKVSSDPSLRRLYPSIGRDIFASQKLQQQQYAQQSQQQPKTTALLQMYTSLRTITYLHDQVNRHLGILPFIWLCELFLSTCLRITQVALLANVNSAAIVASTDTLLPDPISANETVERSEELRVKYHLEYFLEYLTLTIFYLGFIAVIEYLVSQRVTLFQLERTLLRYAGGNSYEQIMLKKSDLSFCLNPLWLRTSAWLPPPPQPEAPQSNLKFQNTCTLIALTYEISRRYVKSRYIAWCKFDLDFRLVFAFINAAAPFSVMILQLHGSV